MQPIIINKPIASQCNVATYIHMYTIMHICGDLLLYAFDTIVYGRPSSHI